MILTFMGNLAAGYRSQMLSQLPANVQSEIRRGADWAPVGNRQLLSPFLLVSQRKTLDTLRWHADISVLHLHIWGCLIRLLLDLTTADGIVQSQPGRRRPDLQRSMHQSNLGNVNDAAGDDMPSQSL